MTKHVLRGLALAALTLGLALPATAQNGSNYQVHSNGFDAVFLGLGAGGAQVAGVDGIGWWVDGCDLVGNSLHALGTFGYKQVTFGMAQCILGAPQAGLSIDFPAIIVIEYDNANATGNPYTFILPTCAPGGLPNLLTSGGAVPYGFAPGTSVNFILSLLPTGTGLPSSTVCVIPEQGLLNGSSTATLIAAGSGNLPINSTGFCWVVQFTWAPSALLGLNAIDGWWYWMNNSIHGNQYWSMSTDEMNLLQSRTIASDQGTAALIAFLVCVDYEFQDKTQNASVNDALAPNGVNGAGPYYLTNANPACSTGPLGGISPNGGFDLGRHIGWSSSGAGGTIGPLGVSCQDPSNAQVGLGTPTLGFVSWNNQLYPLLNNPVAPSTGGTRVVWFQVAWHKILRVITTKGNNPSVLGSPIFNQRVPCGVEFLGPDPWPQTITIDLLLLWAHDTCNATGDAAWPDPWGFPGGTFGKVPIVGSSIHVPISGLSFCTFGVKVIFCYGTVGTVDSTFFAPGFADFTWNPGVASVGNSHSRIFYD